jgi:hypothetical protein
LKNFGAGGRTLSWFLKKWEGKKWRGFLWLRIERSGGLYEDGNELDVLLTAHHGTLMNQHQLDTLFLVCFIKNHHPYISSGVTRPFSGSSAQLLSGVIA